MAKKQMRSLDADQACATDVAAPTSVPSNLVPHSSVAASSMEQVDLDPRTVEISQPFVGRWETLVSTTNWEKGRIIGEWRKAIQKNSTLPIEYSDEAWSRRVGGVTPQHVGRLRRVYERFGSSYASFPRLYWSHFLAAHDWEDAEMWLEGASQSRWSVSQMRRTRWETMGADPRTDPSAHDLVSSSDDEDFSPVDQQDAAADSRSGPREISEGPRPDGPDFGEEDSQVSSNANAGEDELMPWEEQASDPVESPFAKLPALPADLAEAVEQFKLGIIRHRAMGWEEISREDVVLTLEALKRFALQ